jgi:hypothetical protein
MALGVGVVGVRRRRADSIVFFMATTPELSHTLTSNPLHHISTPPPRIHRTTLTNTIRRYKSYLPHSHYHTSNIKTSPTPRSRKTSPLSRIAESFT